jgi:predicted RNA-binding protein with PIN domain
MLPRLQKSSVPAQATKSRLFFAIAPNRSYIILWRPEVPVVIDGNNLLHAARDADALSPLIGRSMLCNTIGRWAELRGERVHIVFDGPAPDAPLAKQIAHPAVQVSYSGSGRTADALLTYLIEGDSAARRLVVVSSDRQVIRAARRRRAKPIGSDMFWRSVKRDLARPAPGRTEPEEKEAGLNPAATQEWLTEFGLKESSRAPDSPDAGSNPRRPPGRRTT